MISNSTSANTTEIAHYTSYPAVEASPQDFPSADEVIVGPAVAHERLLVINPGAPATARHEIFIHSTPTAVWSILTDVQHWKDWNPAVTRAKLNGALVSGTVFDWKSNGFSVRSTLRDIQPARRLSWTGQAFGTRAIHVWRFVAEADGVRVITEESFEGWLVRLMPGAMQKSLDDSLIAMLANLKRAAETVPSKASK